MIKNWLTQDGTQLYMESLGAPAAGSYSLWTAQKSVARDHKRKFNRSMCGVLLGVSIVLVVLGILGIIGQWPSNIRIII